jgi:serpin B
MLRRGAAVTALVGLLAACGPGTAAKNAEVVTQAVAVRGSGSRVAPSAGASTDRAVAGLNVFAANLYRVAAAQDQNLVFSPLSVAVAFAMLRAGAKGETAAQLDRAFGYPVDVDQAYNALTYGLITQSAPPTAAPANSTTADPRPKPPVVTIANGLFTQAGYPITPGFLDTLTQQYGSEVNSVDFGNEAGALHAINGFANDHTAGRIPQILDHLDPMTRLAILNAVFLQASWPEKLEDRGGLAFTTPAGQVDVPSMGKDAQLGYATGPGWSAVAMPYFGDRLAMRILLPDAGRTPADVLTPDVLSAAARTAPTDVILTMPKWDFAARLDLRKLLPKLGVTDAFDANACDLSGITTVEQLFVDQAVHQADITVDELGTVASAVTALTGVGTSGRAYSSPPVTFTVDRPFAFEIVDLKTGAPVFLGSVADPRAH